MSWSGNLLSLQLIIILGIPLPFPLQELGFHAGLYEIADLDADLSGVLSPSHLLSDEQARVDGIFITVYIHPVTSNGLHFPGPHDNRGSQHLPPTPGCKNGHIRFERLAKKADVR